MKKLRIVFMGTSDFAVPILNSLISNGHIILAVYTCSSYFLIKKRFFLRKSPVHVFAEVKGIYVFFPKNLKYYENKDQLNRMNCDFVIVASYGLILSQAILESPKFGCFNIHASVLPKWRGAAPIQRCIQEGDSETGITIIKMNLNLDSGPILFQHKIKIDSSITFGVLSVILSNIGAKVINNVLIEIINKSIYFIPQIENYFTYAFKIKNNEKFLNWTENADFLERTIRAFNPYPGTFFFFEENIIKVYKAKIVRKSGIPGEVLDGKLTIACGKNALRPLLIQLLGKKKMKIAEFLNGTPIPKGLILKEKTY